MDAPPVQYTKTSDGYSIAYSVCGEGQPLVVAPPTFHHLQLVWEEAERGRWVRNLATRYKLVLHDHRGTGLSARGLPSFRPIDRTVDIEAVVDSVGLGRLALVGIGSSCHAAVLYAVRHPDRVAALILVSCSVTMEPWSPAVHQELARDDWETFLHLVSQSPHGLAATSRAVEFRKQAVTQADFLTFTQVPSSIEEELENVVAPTLVIHSRETRFPSREDCAEVASRIPGARLVEVEGGQFGSVGAHDSTIGAIESFLLEVPANEWSETAGTMPQTAERSLSSSQPAIGRLSTRELDVLRLVAAGKSNPQIAKALVISSSTVAKHVTSIFTKTGTANRVEASAFAHRRHLV